MAVGCLSLAGCGGRADTAESAKAEASSDTPKISSQPTRDEGQLGPRSQASAKQYSGREKDQRIETKSQFETRSSVRENAVENNRTLGNLLESSREQESELPPVDEERIKAMGIERHQGEHLVLYTDVRDAAIDEFLNAFDQAVDQWADYFEIDRERLAEFQVRASYIQEKARFERAGLMPSDLPPFLHGYQSGRAIWVYVQPGPYFGRHLLLHEGTHAFMHVFLGGSGPPWYMEGMAELLATHRWEDGKLTLRHRIADREEAPLWGRVKLVRDAVAEERAMPLEQVFQYGWHAHLEIEPYGWCWAACAFFDGHPQYRDRFRAMRDHTADRSLTFSQGFVESLGDEWDQVNEQWQLFITEMDYGYDVAQAAVVYQPAENIPASGVEVIIDGKSGWQSTGVQLRKGQRYRITASGRFQVGEDEAPWISEARGISLLYYRGLPLGRLVGAIRDETQPLEGWSPLVAPFSIGAEGEIEPVHDGTLFLRLNDSPAELTDNRGSVQVRIEPL